MVENVQRSNIPGSLLTQKALYETQNTMIRTTVMFNQMLIVAKLFMSDETDKILSRPLQSAWSLLWFHIQMENLIWKF